MRRTSTRRRVPPSRSPSGFVVVLCSIAALFTLTTAWILLSPEDLAPRQWWARYVEPHLQRKAGAEARGEWEKARDHLDDAIAKAEERKADFRAGLARLRAERRQILSRIRREADALRGWRDWDRRVREAARGPEPWKASHGLMVASRPVRDLCRSTRTWDDYLETEGILKSIPGPPPGWLTVRRDAGRAMKRGEFSTALRLAREVLARTEDREERESILGFLDLLEREAREDYRKRHGKGSDRATLASDLERYRGTRVEGVIRNLLAPGEGN